MKLATSLLLVALPLALFVNGNGVSHLTVDLAVITNTFSIIAADARKLQWSIEGAAAAQRILSNVLGLAGTYTQTIVHAQALNPCPVIEANAPVLVASVTNWTDVLVDTFTIDKSPLIKAWSLRWTTMKAINLTLDNTVRIIEVIQECAPESIKPQIQDGKDRFLAQAAVTQGWFAP